MKFTEYKIAYGTNIRGMKHRQLIDKIIVATMNKDEKRIQELIKSLLPMPESPEKPQEAVKATPAPDKVLPKLKPATPQKTAQKPMQKKPVLKKDPFSHISNKKFKAGKATGEPFAHLKSKTSKPTGEPFAHIKGGK